jgi:hypothetical protein
MPASLTLKEKTMSLGFIIIKRNHDSYSDVKADDQELWEVKESKSNEDNNTVNLFVQDHSKFDGYFKGRCFMSFIGSFPKENWKLEIEWYFYYMLRCDIIENDCDIPCMNVEDWFRVRRAEVYKLIPPP